MIMKGKREDPDIIDFIAATIFLITLAGSYLYFPSTRNAPIALPWVLVIFLVVIGIILAYSKIIKPIIKTRLPRAFL